MSSHYIVFEPAAKLYRPWCGQPVRQGDSGVGDPRQAKCPRCRKAPRPHLPRQVATERQAVRPPWETPRLSEVPEPTDEVLQNALHSAGCCSCKTDEHNPVVVATILRAYLKTTL